MRNEAWCIALLLGTLACGGRARGSSRDGNLPPVVGAAISLVRSVELDEIAQLEYERSSGGGRLAELLASADPRVRRRAALALGRLPFPEYGSEATDPLVRALDDDDPEVRLTAAFALGVRRDPAAGGALAAFRNDPDPRMRRSIVEASRQIEDEHLRTEALLATRDAHLEVRIAAALAAALWDPEAANAGDVDRALLELLNPSVAGPGVEVPAELRWRVLYALQRRQSPRGRGAFLQHADSPLELERIFAIRGLANIDPDPASIEALQKAAADPDWRVACEAVVGLGRHRDPGSLQALLEAAKDTSPHVRRSAFEALGGFAEAKGKVAPRLTRGTRDVSASARAAAVESLARVLGPKEAKRQVLRVLRDEDPVVRAGAAKAAALLPTEEAVEILQTLVGDPNLRVAGTATLGLGRHPTPQVRSLLHDLLLHEDNGIRLWAILALREMPDQADVEPLGQGIDHAQGDIGPEIVFNTIENLGAIGGEAAEGYVRSSLDHPNTYVRRVARRVLAERFAETNLAVPEPASLGTGRVPLPGESYEAWQRNPVVEIRTSRGSMVFELFPEEAPLHVHNFLQLAEQRDYYDGLVFHRVVPDFVIQGGDYRGDGNGAKPWNGSALGQEFTPRHFIRGSLGMPRNEDHDSGGSQFFVTHRPTPHLDGRYTIFGELRAGGEVLDRIEVGDRILDVIRLP